MKKKIKVLVVDDHPIVRKGICSCLAQQKRLKLVGEAADGNEAIRQARALAPDVILMDISMPNMDGLALIELLRKQAPRAKVLALSMYNRKEYIVGIIQAGARGYMLKDATPEELARAIESVQAGETVFSPEVVRHALSSVGENGGSPVNPLARLTERERQVLALIAGEQTNKEIAGQLGVGVRTIETHRERIMRKLEARSVVELTKFAIAHGIVQLDKR